jgi:hypothetical protein
LFPVALAGEPAQGGRPLPPDEAGAALGAELLDAVSGAAP